MGDHSAGVLWIRFICGTLADPGVVGPVLLDRSCLSQCLCTKHFLWAMHYSSCFTCLHSLNHLQQPLIVSVLRMRRRKHGVRKQSAQDDRGGAGLPTLADDPVPGSPSLSPRGRVCLLQGLICPTTCKGSAPLPDRSSVCALNRGAEGNTSGDM